MSAHYTKCALKSLFFDLSSIMSKNLLDREEYSMKRIVATLGILLCIAAFSSLSFSEEKEVEKKSPPQNEGASQVPEVKQANLEDLTKEQQALAQEILDGNNMKYCINKTLAEVLKEEPENSAAKQMADDVLSKVKYCLNRSLSETLKADPQNNIANKLSQDIITKIKEGKSEKEILVHVKRTLQSAKMNPDVDSNTMYDISIVDAPFRGAENAPVTIVEFSDFQCPYCASLAKILNQVDERNSTTVKHVFKNFPLSFHSFARLAAKAALAAGEQGKFWEMRQKLFDNFRTINKENISKYAAELGLDMEKFEKALNESMYDALIDEDIQDGILADVGGTPSIFINGKRYYGKRAVEDLEAAIKNSTDSSAPSQPEK